MSQKDTFGIQFYPTPRPVALRMIKGLELNRGARIYDPSAGRGDLLDVVKENAGYIRLGSQKIQSHIETFAGEIDSRFHQVLRDKGHTVVAGDVFDAPPTQFFDIVVMNPPFGQGVKHLLRVFDAIARGARIRCLLNKRSLEQLPDGSFRNKNQARLAQIIAENDGTVTDLGSECFTEADRQAEVEVVLVDLQEQGREVGFDLNFNPDRAETDVIKIGDFESSELAPADAFAGFESMFQAAVSTFQELLEVRARLNHYIGYLKVESYGKDPVKEALSGHFSSDGKRRSVAEQRYDRFNELLLVEAWEALFQRTKMGRYVTTKVREELEKQIAGMSTMAFTANNMMALFQELAGNQEQIMIDSVLEAFDLITGFNYHNHHDGCDGYKTNSDYKVQEKFILDYMGDDLTGGASQGIGWRAGGKTDNIERALCLMQGLLFEDLDEKRISQVFNYDRHNSRWVRTTFFDVRLFKKGTMHFRWLDDDLRLRFNMLAAKERGLEMPEHVKTGAYR